VFDEENIALQVLKVVGLVVAILAFIVGPLMWTVHRILRPVDRAARARNLPFRFSLGDFLCLFWIVQLPLTFVYRFGDNRRGNDEADQFYWILLATVWGVAPLAWYTVARALSKAGVDVLLYRMVFLGIVLPTVYYGLFPFIGMSIAMMIGVSEKGLAYFLEYRLLATLWFVLALSLIACGFYSPWMIRRSDAFIDEHIILEEIRR
jgi:hypothetical protein